MDVTLYHYAASSSSWRVRWALAVKGIVHRTEAVDLRAGEQRTPEQLARSPLGAVPTLVVDGRALSESVAIIEWLEEVVPAPPLYPRDPWMRARVRQVVELVNAGVQPLQNLVVIERVSADPEVRKAWLREWNERGMVGLERLLAATAREWPGRFAVGDALTAADLFVVPQVASARRYGVDLARFPRVAAVDAAASATEHAAAGRPPG